MHTKHTSTGLSITTPSIVSMPETESMFERTVREIHDALARRAFEHFEYSGYSHGHDHDDWFRAEQDLLRPVPVEISEDENELKVSAEVPGYSANDIDIHLEPTKLLIRGKTERNRERSSGQITYSEWDTNQIFRAINLPTEVEPGKANAVLHDGVLELTLPKAATAKATRVQVRAA
jgi:HSP20 family protein